MNDINCNYFDDIKEEHGYYLRKGCAQNIKDCANQRKNFNKKIIHNQNKKKRQSSDSLKNRIYRIE